MLNIQNKANLLIQDRRISTSIIIYYIIEALNKALKVAIPSLENYGEIISLIFLFFILIGMLGSIKYVLRRSLFVFLIVELLFIFIFIFSLILGNASSNTILNESYKTIFISIPIAIYVLSIHNLKVFYKSLLKISPYIIMTIGISLIFNIYVGDSIYNMPLSFSLIIPTTIQIEAFSRTKNKYYLFWFLSGSLLILLFGARGPLLAILFIILYNTIKGRKTFSKYIFLSIVIVFSIIGSVFYTDIIDFIGYIMSKINIQSRTIDSIINGTLLNSQARRSLFNYYGNMIVQKPLLGWGILGGWISLNLGPHNLFLELYLAFGVILGSILAILIIATYLKIFYTKKSYYRSLLVIYATYSFVLLFTAGSFHTKVNFFVLMVLSILYKNQRKGEIYEENYS